MIPQLPAACASEGSYFASRNGVKLDHTLTGALIGSCLLALSVLVRSVKLLTQPSIVGSDWCPCFIIEIYIRQGRVVLSELAYHFPHYNHVISPSCVVPTPDISLSPCLYYLCSTWRTSTMIGVSTELGMIESKNRLVQQRCVPLLDLQLLFKYLIQLFQDPKRQMRRYYLRLS